MALSAIVYLPALIICYVSAVHCEKDTFTEELWVQPLPTGHLYSYFQFTTKWDFDPEIHGRKFLYMLRDSIVSSISTAYNLSFIVVSLCNHSQALQAFSQAIGGDCHQTLGQRASRQPHPRILEN